MFVHISFKRFQVNANSPASASSSAADSGKFESNLEDLYALCDQIEANLRTVVDCAAQTACSNRYMPIAPQPSRLDVTPGGPAQQLDFLPYPQYVATSKQQVKIPVCFWET